MKDISPKLNVMSAEMEMLDNVFQPSIGQRIGGLSMFSNVFKRGYGANVFGSDENGIWLGAADFPTAPFRVTMAGIAHLAGAIISGAIHVFKQTGIPTSLSIGDLWFDTDDNNKVYRAGAEGATTIASGQWELLNDLRAADALLKAGSSQTLSGDIFVGSSLVKIDGANGRILINDGTNNRIVIGAV